MLDLSHCSLILGCFKTTSDTNKPPPAGRAQRRAERSTIRDLHLQLAALVGDGDPGRSTGQVALAAILLRDMLDLRADVFGVEDHRITVDSLANVMVCQGYSSV